MELVGLERRLGPLKESGAPKIVQSGVPKKYGGLDIVRFGAMKKSGGLNIVLSHQSGAPKKVEVQSRGPVNRSRGLKFE